MPAPRKHPSELRERAVRLVVEARKHVVRLGETADIDGGTVSFGAGSLACCRSDEELRVSNEGQRGLTLLAFLAPSVPVSRSKP